MPIHDWSRVKAGLFHYFHQAWTIEISYALNAGLLPAGFIALAEQVVGGPIPDVVTLQQGSGRSSPQGKGGLAVVDAPPRARFVASAEPERYAARANRIAIKHQLGRLVAVIEVVSPGNKESQHAIRTLADKAYGLLSQGVHLLIVDLFPPSPRDPQGIHPLIWNQIQEAPFELPGDKPLTVAAYCAAETRTAYVEPVAVGDELPSLPIFLDAATYVPAPLEETYRLTWSKCPEALREVVEGSPA